MPSINGEGRLAGRWSVRYGRQPDEDRNECSHHVSLDCYCGTCDERVKLEEKISGAKYRLRRELESLLELKLSRDEILRETRGYIAGWLKTKRDWNKKWGFKPRKEKR